MNFHQSFRSHSTRHQKTTSNLLRISLKGTKRFSNERPLEVEGAMYVNLLAKFSGGGGIRKCIFVLFVCNFVKIWMVSDKTIHKAFLNS